jgi:hypothetical protein
MRTCQRGHSYDPKSRAKRGCPECQTRRAREGMRKWRAENPERARANAKRWRDAHLELERARNRERYRRNRSLICQARALGLQPVVEGRVCQAHRTSNASLARSL